MKKYITLSMITTIFIFSVAIKPSSCSESDQKNMASVLFGIPINSIEDSNLGANYNYNNWGAGSSNTCNGYQGGHAGVDIQTKDVAGNKTANRQFYSLSKGNVITAGGGDYNTIAVYNSETNRTTIYLHARTVNVRTGPVNIGDVLGVQGDTGSPGSEHVHIELREGRKTGPACGAISTIDPTLLMDDPEYINNTCRGATIIPVSNNESANLERINYPGDSDYFKFTLTQSGKITIGSTGSIDTVGFLFSYCSSNPGEGVIAEDDDSGTGSNFKIETTLESGTYYIKIRHFNNSQTGSYILRSKLENDQQENACSSDQTQDCSGKCVSSQKANSWIGDGYCDDGYYGMDLNCSKFNYDDGDCN